MGMKGDDVSKWFERAAAGAREGFEAARRVLSFEEYLAMVVDRPSLHLRDAPRYVKACFEHYGSYEVVRPGGSVRRWRLFDLPFEAPAAEGGRGHRLVGHEAAQEAIYLALHDFAREGRANRLLLLHGPNGSAKSTLTGCVLRALEHFSGTEEGAFYRFSWIFPKGAGSRGGGIGFESAGAMTPSEGSFAHLPEERIETKLRCSLRQHPLLLLPLPMRRDLLERLQREGRIDPPFPSLLWEGDLAQFDRRIFEALMQAYRGDLRRVLAHVQVERLDVSRRQRTGVVTIGPQIHVDAGERALGSEIAWGGLPPSLGAVRLLDPHGELVDAAGGIVEFSDLLKRPLDAWKYLLLAVEAGEVSLSLSNLPVDSVMLATSNEDHLAAFSEHPEYPSFRGRLRLVRVGYLLDYRAERRIYDEQIAPRLRLHVAPHVTEALALWGVLTRLRPVAAKRFEDRALGRVAATLDPMEKAQLYASGKVPARLGTEDAKRLAAAIDRVRAEGQAAEPYEGLHGVSPRRLRELLLEAAHHEEARGCLTPLGLFGRIEALLDQGEEPALRRSPGPRGYYDGRRALQMVTEHWLAQVDEELQGASGLVEDARHETMLARYVEHVGHWIKGEKVRNPVTSELEEPDEHLMRRLEEAYGVEPDEAEAFRKDVMGRIAAFAIDHPEEDIELARVLSDFLERMRAAFFEERRQQLARLAMDVLTLIEEDEDDLDEVRRGRAEAVFETLRERFGYERCCLRVALAELLRVRYADVDA